jgi:MFS family permease
MRQSTYKYYVLLILTAFVVSNYLDRQALGVSLQNIKADFHVSDTQLGLLSGLAFALFYSVMAIPIARWADRGNRVTIICLSATLWSAAVIVSGMATSFRQLLLIRVAVAVGEAGCIPPAFSLLADYFTRAERPRATAIYGMGGGISALIGFSLAGWLNQFYGWRTTFTVVGLPGLILAAVAWFTLKEPRQMRPLPRDASATQPGVTGSGEVHASLAEVGSTLWANTTFRHLLLCVSAMFFFIYGSLQWQPTFMMRSYGLSSGEVGTWIALVFGSGSLAGSYLGGELAARYALGNERLQLNASSIAMVICGCLSMLAYLSRNEYLFIALMGLNNIVLTMVGVPIFATIQTLVPGRMRAVAFALVYLFANLIGMGLGPLTTGALSDALHPWAGLESLRYALISLAPGFLWVAWHLRRASITVAQDLTSAT